MQNNQNKFSNWWWLLLLLAVPVIVLPMVLFGLILFQDGGAKSDGRFADDELYELMRQSDLNDNDLLCSYVYKQSVLGSGAGTQSVTMILIEDKQELVSLNNALLADGFKAVGYWDSVSVHTNFEKNISDSREATVEISYIESGDKSYADDNCSSGFTLSRNYTVPRDRTLAKIRYIVTTRQRI